MRGWSTGIHRWSGYLLALLGMVHASLAVSSLLKGPDRDTVWFAGTGLAVVLLVLLNVALRRGGFRDPITRRLTHAANLGFLGFGFAAVVAVAEPQAYTILALLAVQAATAFALLAAPRS